MTLMTPKPKTPPGASLDLIAPRAEGYKTARELAEQDERLARNQDRTVTLAAQSAAAARELQTEDRRYNVRASPYYAVGNGTTDDTAAIQAALDDAGRDPGRGVVWFPANYEFKVFARLEIPAGVSVEGPGATIELDATASTTSCLEIEGDGVAIRGLTLVGPNVGTFDAGWIGVRAEGAVGDNYERIVLEGLIIEHFGEAGVSMEHCADVSVRGCSIRQCGQYGIRARSVVDFHVRECHIGDLSPGDGGNVGYENMYGVTFTRQTTDLATSPASERCSVTDCIIEDVPTWKGLDTHGGLDITFANNSVRRCYIGIGLDESDEAGGAGDFNSPRRVVIANNHLVADGASAKVGPAILATAPGTTDERFGRGLVISGNTITGYGGNANAHASQAFGAIYVGQWKDVSIVGNHVFDSRRAAVWVTDPVENMAILGNTITDLVTHSSLNTAFYLNETNLSATIDGNTHRRTAGTYVAYTLAAPAANYGVYVGPGEIFLGTITDYDTGSLANVAGGSFAGLLTVRDGIRSTGTSPSIANGAAAGTSPGAPSLVGTDRAGVITIVTGTATTTGTLATITFATTKADGDYVVLLFSAGVAASAEIAKIRVTNRLAGSWLINVPTTALTISTTYTYQYLVEAYEP